MRLTVSISDGPTAREARLEVRDDAVVADLADALGASSLWCGAESLDLAQLVGDSVVRHGVALGVGGPVADVRREPGGLVEVRVTGGPGAGQVVRLDVGEHTLEHLLGTELRVTVRADSCVEVAPGPGLALEAEPLTGPTLWPHGAQVTAGPVLLEVHPVGAADAALTPTPGDLTLDLNRPPRLLPPRRATTFSLPAEPKRPDKQPLPLAMMLVPVVVGVVLYAVTRSAYSLLFVGMTPLMALAGWSTGARQQRRRWKAEMREHTRRTTKVRAAAQQALVDERTARRRDHADPAAVLLTATGPRVRLWERRRTDTDFLSVRVGTADQGSEVSLHDPARETHEGPVTWTAPDVPVVVPLAEVGVLGIAGDADVRRGIGRSVLGQLAVLHAPSDLAVEVVGGSDADWRWLRWLPHASDRSRAVDARIAALTELVDRRWAARDSGAVGVHPAEVVVLDGARDLRLLPGVADLLRRGPAVGVCFVCLDAEARLLPEECRAVVRAGGAGEPSSVAVAGADLVEGVRAEPVAATWAERVARALAPVREAADPSSDRLPTSARLVDVLGQPSVSRVVDGWARSPRSTSAVVGVGADGPYAVDLVADGPHALIAGTTGAGKSELLQTLIASLALANRPDEMTFVLVDYKGGAAFAQCADLPHTVGMVTDLDGHLTSRALDSLSAELRRREGVLLAAGVKDIEAYAEARDAGRPAQSSDVPALPRLVIVVDEFAALAAELPDFVTGLVDLARRGRSLGVHLVLATQRPAGVVSAEIRANTSLRIALRVTDAADSRDVIDADTAVIIDAATPGRAYARLGAGEPVAFQAARVGGRASAADDGPPVRLLSAGPDPAPAPGEADGPTDLAGVVAALQGAAREAGVRPPTRPWLDPLPEVVTLDDLAPAETDRVVFGLADVPAEQRREPAVLDLAAGRHLGIVAGPRAGRSTALRTIAGAIARSTSPEAVHVHAVDCGSNALLPLVALPHVGVVVTRDQPDRMSRLVERLRRLVAERQQALATAGFADIAEQRAAVPAEERLPYVVVLIDRWEGLVAAYDSVDGGALVLAWQQLLQEGGAVGVTVVVTGDRTLGVGRMAALIDDRLMLRMPEPGDYAAIGLLGKQVPPTIPGGRGFRAAGLRETQVALLDVDPSGTAQVAALQRIGRQATATWTDVRRERRPLRLDVLPVRITLAEALALPGQAGSPHELALAVGGDSLGLRCLDPVRHGPALLVAGPRRSGRSTALRAMATFALPRGLEVVVVTPRTSPLRALCDEPGVHGPFDPTSDPTEVSELLAKLRDADAPSLTLVDDVELLGADGWLPALLEQHLDALRDSGSVLAGAGSPAEIGATYRGLALALKRSGSGVLLSPQSSTDADLFGARLPRSALGHVLASGAGYLVTSGQVERVQVVWPE